MTKINLKNISYSYGDKNILDNISLSIDTSWKLALIGKNGQGKTTLLKIISNYISDYKGTIKSDVNINYFPYDVDENDLVLNIVTQFDSSIQYWQIVKEFNILKLKEELIYQPFKLLSGGEKIKVLLISLFIQNNDYIILDEPTNHLDIETKSLIADYLNKQNGFLIVSHDRDFINKTCNHIAVIKDRKISIKQGNYNTYYDDEQKRIKHETTINNKLEKEIKKLEESFKKAKSWSNSKEKEKTQGKNKHGLKPDKGALGAQSARLMKKAKNFERRIENNLEEKKSLLVNEDYIPQLHLKDSSKRGLLIQVNNLSFGYDNLLFNKLSFNIYSGDIFAIKGNNGSGKTTLLQLLTNQLQPQEGIIKVKPQTTFFKVDQESEYLNGSYKDIANAYNINETMLYTILRKLDFSRDLFEKRLEYLSSGQKKKVLLAISIIIECDIIIWDEVFNYLDISARLQIESMFNDLNKTIILVEHDDFFINKYATSILQL